MNREFDYDYMSEEERREWEENFDARAEARMERAEALWYARRERGEELQRIKDDHPSLELERRDR